ncbi:hypothetical protein ACH4LK_14770 [Streptomyces lydicus]|uniref:hypothetical protein n=1 Tax=Streptomyces lydicus TaxID=47763 RepID=UPI0037BD26F6
MSAAHRRKRRLPRLRWAIRHPYQTLLRNHDKAISSTGFGLGQAAVIGSFTIGVVGWLTYQYVVHLGP